MQFAIYCRRCGRICLFCRSSPRSVRGSGEKLDENKIPLIPTGPSDPLAVPFSSIGQKDREEEIFSFLMPLAERVVGQNLFRHPPFFAPPYPRFRSANPHFSFRQWPFFVRQYAIFQWFFSHLLEKMWYVPHFRRTQKKKTHLVHHQKCS